MRFKLNRFYYDYNLKLSLTYFTSTMKSTTWCWLFSTISSIMRRISDLALWMVLVVWTSIADDGWWRTCE